MHSALSSQPLAFLAGISVMASLAGCDVTIKDGDLSVARFQGRATQEWSRKYSVAPAGRVEIVNVNGPVDVGVGPSGTVAVAAVLTAKAMTEERAKQILSEAKIEESAAPDHIRVATVRRDRSRGPGGLEVAYTVTVPADARVELSANNGALKADGLRGHVKAIMVNGDVELTGLRGTVDAASVNGPLSIKMAEVTGRIRLESMNGRISLEVPKDTKATLNVRSMNGRISVTGLDTQKVDGDRIRNLESVLNGGGPEIDVRVTNGRITITGAGSSANPPTPPRPPSPPSPR